MSLTKITALFFIFALPLYIITTRYGTTENVEIVRTGYGFIGTILIYIVGFVAIYFVSTQLITQFKQNKFGYFSITLIGAFMVLILIVGYITLASVTKSIEGNLQAFLEQSEYHMQTLQYMITSASIGAAVAFIRWALKIDLWTIIANKLKKTP